MVVIMASLRQLERFFSKKATVLQETTLLWRKARVLPHRQHVHQMDITFNVH